MVHNFEQAFVGAIDKNRISPLPNEALLGCFPSGLKYPIGFNKSNPTGIVIPNTLKGCVYGPEVEYPEKFFMQLLKLSVLF